MISSRLQFIWEWYHKYRWESSLGKVLYTDFEDIDSIITSMMDNPVIKKAVAKTYLNNIWDKILPEKYRKKSRPYSMLPGGTMIVACENSVVAQELSLRKITLIQKFQPYMQSLNLNVKDFKFDPKKWS